MKNWSFLDYDELTKEQLYEILKHRAYVFVVKQKSCYQDLDELDQQSYHLFYAEDNAIKAYCRLIRKENKESDKIIKIGRVLVIEEARGKGLAHQMMKRALQEIEKLGVAKVLLSAQLYIADFYKQYGFNIQGSSYMDVGVEHVDMVKHLR